MESLPNTGMLVKEQSEAVTEQIGTSILKMKPIELPGRSGGPPVNSSVLSVRVTFAQPRVLRTGLSKSGKSKSYGEPGRPKVHPMIGKEVAFRIEPLTRYSVTAPVSTTMMG